jgi:hypothetical protein
MKDEEIEGARVLSLDWNRTNIYPRAPRTTLFPSGTFVSQRGEPQITPISQSGRARLRNGHDTPCLRKASTKRTSCKSRKPRTILLPIGSCWPAQRPGDLTDALDSESLPSIQYRIRRGRDVAQPGRIRNRINPLSDQTRGSDHERSIRYWSVVQKHQRGYGLLAALRK